MRLLLLAACLAPLMGCRRGERAAGPLPQEIYVWQRAWSGPVEAALRAASGEAAGFAVLAAEIDLRPAQPKIVRPKLNFAALAATQRPIALGIRIDPFPGPFRPHDRIAETLVKLAREEVARAREHGLGIRELQIDFDCGEAKLDGYRAWLTELRAAVRPVPVIPTVLPSWLGHREFATLARESGGFILQVHSVAVPARIEDTRKMTNPRAATAWVEQAARAGVPFRVSLPTYAYLVAFDAQGKFRGLSAEGSPARWPEEATRIRWETDPAEMAALVAQWTRARPALLRGVFWYRLPVASDNLNWSWKTLAMAMRGQAPRGALDVTASDSQPSEIIAANIGEQDEPLPEWIEAHWNGAKLIAADALQGYELQNSPDGQSARFELTAAGRILRLPPEGRRNVGWLRCEPPTPIQISVAARALPAGSAAVGGSDRH